MQSPKLYYGLYSQIQKDLYGSSYYNSNTGIVEVTEVNSTNTSNFMDYVSHGPVTTWHSKCKDGTFTIPIASGFIDLEV